MEPEDVKLGELVTVVGYPRGGEKICLTKACVHVHARVVRVGWGTDRSMGCELGWGGMVVVSLPSSGAHPHSRDVGQGIVSRLHFNGEYLAIQIDAAMCVEGSGPVRASTVSLRRSGLAGSLCCFRIPGWLAGLNLTTQQPGQLGRARAERAWGLHRDRVPEARGPREREHWVHHPRGGHQTLPGGG